MLPISDDDRSRKSVPWVTYALVALNVVAFILELNGGDAFIHKWAFIPSRFLANPQGNFVTIFTSMFLHGGWLHLGGNMLFLWIFGDNVEDAFGYGKYLIFYLLCGVAAVFAQLAFSVGSSVPMLGASGAIAGVLGSYLLLFPQQQVQVMVGRSVTQVSALLVIGGWIILQLLSGVAAITTSAQTGGVAYFAHIGGFLAGLLLTYIFTGKSPTLLLQQRAR